MDFHILHVPVLITITWGPHVYRYAHTYMYVVHFMTYPGTWVIVGHLYMYIHETLGLSMELNDDILVQTTSLQTIARVKRVKCFMLHKVA